MLQVKRRYVTLIEIMIVMFLIALIAGVVAYNYRGSLDEGRAFETKANIEKLKNILELEIAKSPSANYSTLSEGGWRKLVEDSPLVKDKVAIFLDGWGTPLVVDFRGTQIEVYSTNQFCIDHPDKCPGRQGS